ncbi:hypothetical protein HDU83_000597 [Entophlyctis luteolus]|nr:hypothetical protein HDU83_000597 [Entophlyctis luteolus]
MEGGTIEPIALVPQHIRSLASTAKRTFPWTQTTPTGLVAIIDISGYSKLSSHLQEVLGNDSGAKIKELLNPPMEVIIENVHQTGGSIVKFAGDAVIATWSHKSGSDDITRGMIMSAFLCSLNLLNYFRDYTVSVEESSKGSFRKESLKENTDQPKPPSSGSSMKSMASIDASIPVHTNTIAKKINYSRKLSFAHTARKFVSQPLKVHIGLGFGETQLVHIGVHRGLKFPKSEFFIAGKSLSLSGVLLELSQRGEFAFDTICWDLLKEEVEMDAKLKIRTVAIPQSAGTDQKEAYIISENNALDNLITSIEDRMCEFQFNPGQLDTGLERTPMKFNPSVLDELSAYMDDALARAIMFTAKRVQADTTPESFIATLKSQVNSIFDAHDQLRNLSVVFIRFIDFRVDTIAEPGNLKKLQQLMAVVMKALHKFDGTLRQFNCDDKALTALLVWGLQGYSHEKGEAGYALSAAFEMAKRFEPIVGSSFSIGITNGPVFSGIIGNRTRADGTVLGVAVNNAARLMCLDMCHGSILCDESTYSATKDSFQFNEDIPVVKLKGALNPVKIYQPLAIEGLRHHLNVLGRHAERELIAENVHHWKRNGSKQLFLTGRSGLGKSVLMENTLALLNAEQSVIVCTGRGREYHRNTQLFCYGQLLANLFTELRSRGIYFNNTLTSGNLETNIMNSTSFTAAQPGSLRGSTESFGENEEIHEFIRSNFPSNFGEILSCVPGLKVSSNKFPPGSDVVAKLLMTLSKIFTMLEAFAKVTIFIDDFQWCDEFSFELTYKLIQKCPNLFFFIVSRPPEEYTHDGKQVFQKLLASPHVTHIQLEPLDVKGIEILVQGLFSETGDVLKIDPKVANEILNQSQGNTLVAHSMIAMMKESGQICIENDTVVMSQKQIKFTGTDSVVTAQFDKLVPELKELLRVASVAGQYFNLNDILFVMNETSNKSKKYSKAQILNTIEQNDTYQFVTKTETPDLRKFSHSIVMQAIYSTLIPSKRLSLHGAFADFYEKSVEAGKEAVDIKDDAYSAHLQSLIYHLSKLESQEDRKQKFIYKAFLDSAEYSRGKEAFAYYNLLSSFEKKIPQAVTLLEQAKECRLLGQMHFELGNFKEAVDNSLKAFAVFGFEIPTSDARRLRQIYRMYKTLRLLLKAAPTVRIQIARQFAVKAFPLMHRANEVVQAIKPRWRWFFGRDTVTQPTEDLFNVALDEIFLNCEFITKPLIIVQIGTMILHYVVLGTLVAECTVKYRELRLSRYYCGCACAFWTLGMRDFAEKAWKESEMMLQLSQTEEALKNPSNYAKGIYGILHDSRGIFYVQQYNFQLGISEYRKSLKIIESIGMGHMEKHCYSRFLSHFCALM